MGILSGSKEDVRWGGTEQEEESEDYCDTEEAPDTTIMEKIVSSFKKKPNSNEEDLNTI